MTTTEGYLDVSDGQLDSRQLAYVKTHPTLNSRNLPTVVFFHGLFSSMAGGKAVMLQQLAQKLDFPFIRFDFTACGKSSGNPLEVSMTGWKKDALAVIDQLTEGSVVVVGSSLGGWLMLLVALERANRIRGLVGVASAPDFLIHRIDSLDDASKNKFQRDGTLKYPDVNQGPYTITKEMYEDADRNRVLSGNTLHPVSCKVRLIHGQRDDVVPFGVSMALSEKLTGCRDVDVILRKNGEHRMSEIEDLELIQRTLVDGFLRTPEDP